MPTLVLGSAASHQTVETFIEQLGDEAIRVIDSAGRIRARVIPAAEDESTGSAENASCHSDALYQRFEADFWRDVDELKRRALQPRSGITTEKLLNYLNSLPLPD